MKFHNINMRKRKQGNIFSNERTINYDTGVRVDRNILPQSNFTTLNSPNTTYSGSANRAHSGARKGSGNESVFQLKRQIKDLRELLKEKDQMLLEQKFSLNLNTMESNLDERDTLMHENQQLRRQLSLLTDKQGENSSAELNHLKRENESLKKQAAKLEESRWFC